MLERTEDSWISRLLLCLWLPMAALVGIGPLGEEHPLGLTLRGEAGATLADDGISSAGFDLPPPSLVRPVCPPTFPPPGVASWEGDSGGERLEPVHPPRHAYVRLLRSQLLRIPDPSDA